MRERETYLLFTWKQHNHLDSWKQLILSYYIMQYPISEAAVSPTNVFNNFIDKQGKSFQYL